MMDMTKFIEKWSGSEVEAGYSDADCERFLSEHPDVEYIDRTNMNPVATKFAKDLFLAVKNSIGPDYLIKKKRIGHYDLSFFVESSDGMIDYISYSMPRYGLPVDPDDSGCVAGVLYRGARTTSDYTGGRNRFSSIRDLPDAIVSHFEQRRRWGDSAF